MSAASGRPDTGSGGDARPGRGDTHRTAARGVSRRAAALLCAAAALSALAVPLGAQSPDPDRRSPDPRPQATADWEAARSGAWEFAAYIGLLNDEPEWNPDEAGEDADQLRRDAIFGLRLGYIAPVNLFLQAELANSPLLVQPPGVERRNANTWLVGGSVGYVFRLHRTLQAFPVVGIGLVDWNVDGAPDQTESTLHYGLGGRYFLHRRLAVRADARVHRVGDALDETRGAFASPPGEEDLYALELSIGVSYLLGGRRSGARALSTSPGPL